MISLNMFAFVILLTNILNITCLNGFKAENQIQFNYNGKVYKVSDSNLDEVLRMLNSDENKAKVRKARSLIKNENEKLENVNYDLLLAEQLEITGPQCIPLKSKNIEANPYHPSLLSKKGAEVRKGLGLPKFMKSEAIRCDSTQKCSYTYSQSFTTEVSNSYSISLSDSNSFSKSVGKQDTKGSSNSITNSIGKSIERSISKSITTSDEVSISNQISDSLTNTHDESSGITLSNNRDISQTDTLTQDISESDSTSNSESSSQSKSRESSVSSTSGGSRSRTKSSGKSHSWSASATVGGGIGLFSASATVGGGGSYSSSSSNTDESNWSQSNSNSQSSSNTESVSRERSKSLSKSNGKSNSRTNSHSSGASKDNRVSDSISISRQAAITSTSGKSESKSDTDTEGSSYRTDDSFSSNEENSISNSLNLGKEKSNSTSISNTTSFSISTTTSSTYTYEVNPGECKFLVCMSFVYSTVIPYQCFSSDSEDSESEGPKEKIYPVQIFMVDTQHYSKGNLTCALGLLSCSEKDSTTYFLSTNDEFNKADQNGEEEVLKYGQIKTDKDGDILVSKSKTYRLVLQEDGNLVIMQHSEIHWQNNMNYFKPNQEKRIRINRKGHLVEEVKGSSLFAKNDYRQNDWIPVWSSAPINHNVTIGISHYSGNSYALVMSNKGFLNMYDAVGALIWCTQDSACKHNKGYKFPEVYLMPLKIKTKEDSKDKHNKIDNKIKFLDRNPPVLMSLEHNKSCDAIQSHFGIQSKNKQFKMILEDSGNLIVKDGHRTMWESCSANMPYAVGPYKLVLVPTGNLMILSSNRYIIWSTSTQHLTSTSQEKGTYINGTFMTKNEKFSYPFKLTLTDEGFIVVTDKSGQVIWDSSPLNEKAIAYNIFEPIEYVFVPCDRENKPKKSKRDLISFEDMNNRVNRNEKLISSNGIWDLAILQNKTIAIRKLNVITYVLYELPEEKRSTESINDLVLEEDGSLTLKNENNRIIKYLFKSKVKVFSEKFTLKLSKNGLLSIEALFSSSNNNSKSIWQFPRPKLYSLLESNGIYNLKVTESLISNSSSNAEKFALVFNQQSLNVVSSTKVGYPKEISIPCLSKQKCVLDELILRHDGNLVLLDKNARIVWQSNSKVDDYTKLGPFRLLLDEKSETLIIVNRKNGIEWKKTLE